MSESPRVEVFTRPDCHLCEDAIRVVDEICTQLGERWREIDITDNAELTRRYTEMVPVTLVDGVQHDYWRVDADRLRRALSRGRERPAKP